MKTVAIMHQAQTSGPSKTLRPSLERLASHGELEVVVPGPDPAGPGTVATHYADIARVVALSYRPLTVPGTPAAAVSATLCLARQAAMLCRHLRASEPDLIVVATTVLPHALLAARLARVPVIVRVAEIFDKGHIDGLVRGIGGAVVRLATARLADSIVCSSEAVARQFSGSNRSVTTIYPGIDPGHAAGDGPRFRHDHALDDGDPLVVVVGNITRARGQDLAIRALPALLEAQPAARLAIVGAPHIREADEDNAASLRSLVRELDLAERVTFTGFVETVADVYAAADIVLNPARFNEPFGRAALEGLLAGCPVVATRVGAIPEILTNDRNSLLVASEDVEAIAAALIALANDPGLRGRLAAAGGQLVRREYGITRVADDFERIAVGLTECSGGAAVSSG